MTDDQQPFNTDPAQPSSEANQEVNPLAKDVKPVAESQASVPELIESQTAVSIEWNQQQLKAVRKSIRKAVADNKEIYFDPEQSDTESQDFPSLDAFHTVARNSYQPVLFWTKQLNLPTDQPAVVIPATLLKAEIGAQDRFQDKIEVAIYRMNHLLKTRGGNDQSIPSRRALKQATYQQIVVSFCCESRLLPPRSRITSLHPRNRRIFELPLKIIVDIFQPLKEDVLSENTFLGSENNDQLFLQSKVKDVLTLLANIHLLAARQAKPDIRLQKLYSNIKNCGVELL